MCARNRQAIVTGSTISRTRVSARCFNEAGSGKIEHGHFAVTGKEFPHHFLQCCSCYKISCPPSSHQPAAEIDGTVRVSIEHRPHGVSIINASAQRGNRFMVIDADDESSSHCHLLAIVQSQRINERRDIGQDPYLRIYPNEFCAVVLFHPNTEHLFSLFFCILDFPLLPRR